MTTPEPSPLSEQELKALEEYTWSLVCCVCIGPDSDGNHDDDCQAPFWQKVSRAIAQARAARPSPWLPIAEHNKTPFVVLVGWVNGASVERGVFDRRMANGMWRSADKRGNPLFDPQPTHWQPLPPAPSGETA